MDIQYVIGNEGKRIAVQILIEQWETIKADLGVMTATAKQPK